MEKLLYIESSPRKQRSSSIAVANTFLEAYRNSKPKDEITTIDLWKKQLPAFDGDTIDTKYAIMHGKAPTDAQVQAWKVVEAIIKEFTQADKYVISMPMWNFNIPYKLKHYIDILVQPGYTFTITPAGEYQGLVTGKKVLLIYASGGAYGPETGITAMDHQKPYMEMILKYIGFQNFTSIVVEPTLASPELKEKSLADAKEKAKQIALTF